MYKVRSILILFLLSLMHGGIAHAQWVQTKIANINHKTMKTKQIIIGLLLVAYLLIGCVNNYRKVENLHTFAKAYGYVRWFYPGDEAAQVDWNKFAVYGIQKVENARNEKELKKILAELFKPIAPAIQIFETNHTESFDVHSIIPQDTSELNTVSWKHYGVGFERNPYKSVRLNRDSIKEFGPCFIHYMSDISQYRGKQVKLIFSAKSINNSKGNAFLFMSFQEKSDTIKDQGQTTLKLDTVWNEYSRIISVGMDDIGLEFGIGIDKSVTLLISDIRLMVKENNFWIPIKLNNGNFEQELDGWITDRIYYDVSLDSIRSESGNRCVKINYTNNKSKIGEYINKNIGNNLTFIMPLALYSNKEHTFPVSDLNQLNRLKEQLIKIPDSTLNKENRSVQLANVIIIWNVFQHFYPYFDVIHVDWEKELTKTLQDIYTVKTKPEYYKSLMKMTAKLECGDVGISGGDSIAYGLKVNVDLFDNDLVVISSGSDLLQKGDIIKIIDGKSAMEEILGIENFISGSPNVKRYRALRLFGIDFSQGDAQVTLIRDSKEIKIKVSRVPLSVQESGLLFAYSHFFISGQFNNTFEIIDCGDSIYYLKGQIQDINSILGSLVNAKGIIVGSMNQLWDLLPHMITEPVWIVRIFIPINIYPDREKTFWDVMGRWSFEPKLPFIKAKFAILTSPNDICGNETVLGIIDYYKLGKLIGDTTGGCNGNTNLIPLIGDNSVLRWTGMKVLKHDYSQHFLIGFYPDYPVTRTKEAVIQGRDEYLEKAIEILKKN